MKKKKDDGKILHEIKKILSRHPRSGCQMVYMKLRQSMKINHKKAERIYYENSLSLKKRTFRRKQKIGRPAPRPAAETGRWLAMDFVTDSVGNRRAIRILTAVDPITKEAVIVKPCFSMTGREVSEELEKAAGRNGPLLYLQTDNGPEFRSRALEEWSIRNNVKHIYSRPGKPTDNCFAEAFNRILRMECLEANYFPDMTNAGKIIEEWTDDYNRNRPQKGLKGLTPEQFKSKLLSAKPNLNSGRTLG